jgi:hypothetical protein
MRRDPLGDDMTDCTMLDGVMTVIISELGSLSYEERRHVIEALEALYPPRGAIVPVPFDFSVAAMAVPNPRAYGWETLAHDNQVYCARCDHHARWRLRLVCDGAYQYRCDLHVLADVADAGSR